MKMTESLFPALKARPRSGAEPFHVAGVPAGFDVMAFWRWAASDLVGNALRGVLAEFLVARAIGAVGEVRTEWDACDLQTAANVRVEVKSAAYVQSWSQRALSAISFDIAPKRGWDAATGTIAASASRYADVYVFALLAHQDKGTIDPLDLTQWSFYVTSAAALNVAFSLQKRIALTSLLRVAPEAVPYEALSAAVAVAATAIAAVPAPSV
ncbi:MAG: hypothetical protein ACR2M1_13860 [Gemmatimonadaceae bacterium]